jgi:hypothetical protein
MGCGCNKSKRMARRTGGTLSRRTRRAVAPRRPLEAATQIQAQAQTKEEINEKRRIRKLRRDAIRKALGR